MYPSVLDTTAFPHLAAYLDALPGGLDTYPEAKTRNTLNAILQKQLHDVFASRRLPEALHHPLHDPGTPNQWAPTTVHAALCALARDCLCESDAAYTQHIFNIAMDINRMEDFKVLMTIRSPTLITMQAPKRWEGFNQGSSLVVNSQGKNSIAFSLIYPAHLFSGPSLITFGAIISASVSTAGGQRPVAVVTDSKPTQSDFFLKWGL